MVDRVRASPNARVAVWLFLLVAGVYLFTAGGHSTSVDEEVYLQSTRGLMHGSLTLDVTPGNDKVLVRTTNDRGEAVQVGTLGHPLLALPAHVLGQVLARTGPVDQRDYVIRLFTFFQNSIIGALTAVALFLLCLRLGATRRWAVILALVYAFGTWAWPHAKTFFSEPGAALFLTLAVLAAVRARQGRADRWAAWAGAAAWAAVNVRSSSGIALVPLAVYLAWPPGAGVRQLGATWRASGRTLAWFVLGGLPLALLLGASQWARFGSPFDLGYPDLPTGTPIYEGLLGLLASPGKGLIFYAPIAVVAAFALPRAFRRRRAEALLMLSIVALTFLLLSRLQFWNGDAAYGPRYLIPVLPLVVALVAPATVRLGIRRAAAVAGVIGALVPALVGVAIYFNAAYTTENIELAQQEGALSPSAQREVVWWVPRWSPLAEHFSLLDDAVRNGVDRIDGNDPTLDARPIPPAPNDLVYWYAAPVQLDTWWAWWLPMGMPWPYLLMAPLFLAAAALGGVRLRRRLRTDGAAAGMPPAVARRSVGAHERLLGRAPTHAEAAAHADHGDDLSAIAAAVAASDEHRALVAAGTAPGVLAGSTAAEAALPVGAHSADGVAVVGQDGWLFIERGANDYLQQYLGASELTPEWRAAWTDLLDHYRDEAAACGARLAALVVPDKLAVYEDRFPAPLEPAQERPAEALLAAHPGRLAYPIEALAAARRSGDVYFRCDSHVNPAGAAIVFRAALEGLGVAAELDLRGGPRIEALSSGDLGSKFVPEICEVVSVPVPDERIDLVEDNARQMLAVGGHLGLRRVARNLDAPLDATLVVFGDSYAYVEPAAPGNLGDLLARTFREVHFMWAPFCWDPAYVRTVAPDFVLVQAAERFLVSVPRRDVDVAALAEETLARKAGITPPEISNPRTHV